MNQQDQNGQHNGNDHVIGQEQNVQAQNIQGQGPAPQANQVAVMSPPKVKMRLSVTIQVNPPAAPPQVVLLHLLQRRVRQLEQIFRQQQRRIRLLNIRNSDLSIKIWRLRKEKAALKKKKEVAINPSSCRERKDPEEDHDRAGGSDDGFGGCASSASGGVA